MVRDRRWIPPVAAVRKPRRYLSKYFSVLRRRHDWPLHATRVAQAGSQLFHDDAARRVDKHMIVIAVLAGDGVVAVCVALGVHYFVTGHTLQRDRGSQIPGHGRILGAQQTRAAEHGDDRENENEYAAAHGVSCSSSLKSQFGETLPDPRECPTAPLARTRYSPP